MSNFVALAPQAAHTRRIFRAKSSAYAVIALSICAPYASLYPAPSYAQTSPSASGAPALVVPKEEINAENELPALSNNPDARASAHSLAGAFLSSYVAHNQGDLDQALIYLRDAYQKDPTNLHIAGQVLILEITLGHIPQAVRIAKQLQKVESHELIVDLLLAVDAMKQQQPKQAAKILADAKSDSFEHIWLPLLLEWMTPKNQRTQTITVEDILGETTEEIPSFVHYHVGLLNDARGFTEAAKQHYQEATQDIARAPFRALLAHINLKAREDTREDIQQLLLDLKKDRPDMEALLRQELPYLNQLADESPLAVSAFVQTPEEGLAEVLLTMASMLYTLDISQDIPLYLQMSIYLRPDFPTAQLMLGNYFESLQLWSEATNAYQKIRKTSPLFLKANIRRAFVLEMRGEQEAALALVKQLAKNYPASLDVWMSAGDLERKNGHFEPAIAHYSQAIKLLGGNYKKQHWPIFFSRGSCYEQLKQYPNAERDLRQARNLSPEQPEVLNYIGYMWLDQDKEVFEAIRLIERAYKLSPNQPHIIDSMGWAFFKTGELDKSIAMLERAAEMLPNDATINEHLGDSYWHADRILEARYQWLRAKDFAENANQRSHLEQKIAKGLSTYSFHTRPLSGAAKPAATTTPKVAAPAVGTIERDDAWIDDSFADDDDSIPSFAP